MAETRLLHPIHEPWPIFDLPPGVKRRPGVGVFSDSSLEKTPRYFPRLLVSGPAAHHPHINACLLQESCYSIILPLIASDLSLKITMVIFTHLQLIERYGCLLST